MYDKTVAMSGKCNYIFSYTYNNIYLAISQSQYDSDMLRMPIYFQTTFNHLVSWINTFYIFFLTAFRLTGESTETKNVTLYTVEETPVEVLRIRQFIQE